ncbi:MAG: toxin-antitoxin system YwqK family antitoxin, partial [Bacteroidales bacterium]
MHKQFLILIFLSILALQGFTQELTQKDGLYYKQGALYTGTHHEKYDNGNKKLTIHIENGLPDGKMMLYYKDGSQKEQRYYKEGKKHNVWIEWDKEGNKTAE